MPEITLPLVLFLVAIAYAIVGHGGASGYLAILALFGLSIDSLRPAVLVLNIIVSGIGLIGYSKNKMVNWRILGLLALFSIPCSFIGGKIEIDKSIIEKIIGIALLISAIIGLFKANTKEDYETTHPNFPILASTGGILGLLAGLTGIGGGVFLSPLMLHLKWAKIREISGIAAGFIFLNSMAGLIARMNKPLHLPPEIPIWVVAVILGGIIGSWLGRKQFSTKYLRFWLSLILLSACAKLLL